jgi:nucleoside-diphosphate-sugar epimerase
MENSHRAIQQMEEMVLSSQSPVGIVLRYGFFYGPGTFFDPAASMIDVVRKGGFPVIGKGTGVWSFIHIEDAAEATRIAIEDAPAGTYHVTDDHPAAAGEWLPELARLLDAKPPKRVPIWLGKLVAGASTVFMMTRMRGAANGKAKRVFQWKPNYADWRQGFAAMLRRPS